MFVQIAISLYKSLRRFREFRTESGRDDIELLFLETRPRQSLSLLG
jgi:hypothetical protein